MTAKKMFAQLAMLLLLLLASSAADAYKILIIVPGASNSQLIFNHAVAEQLANRGHDVTIYNAVYSPMANKPKPANVKEITFQAVPDEFNIMAHLQTMDPFRTDSAFNWSMVTMFAELFPKACEHQISNKELMAKLRAEKFDIAFGHMYDLCPHGIIKALGIPTYIWMSSGVLLDTMAQILGAPSIPSYVPNVFTRNGDRMDHFERAINLFAHTVTYPLFKYVIGDPETAMFRKHFGQDFPHLFQLAAESPLVFINSEELLDFPRPTLHKIVYIGGIGMKAPKPLNAEWEQILKGHSSKKGIVVLSFGSVAPTQLAPEELRRNIANAFKKFPDYLFIARWEGQFPEAAGMENLVLKSWVPQKDLLAHPKTRLLISHGGYNSILESVNAGCPVLAIPLFGDQMGNLKRVQRAGVGSGIYKEHITEHSLTRLIRELLENSSYAENAQRLSKMIRKKPISAEDLLVKWTEFLAEFKTLPNLQPVGPELNYIEYISLDIIPLVLLAVFIVLWLVYKIFRLYIWSCFGGSHQRPSAKEKEN